MKSLITLVIIAVAALSFAGASMVVTNGDEAKAEEKPTEKPWLEPEPVAEVQEFEENCCWCDDVEQNGFPDDFASRKLELVDDSDHGVDRERMEREVEMLWDLWFDDNGASVVDRRRRLFSEYAGYVVDAVTMYQSEETDIGGKLPGHMNDHLVVAYTIAMESSVTYDAVGTSRKERGLMQLHGVALAGYAPDKVQRNPRLGVLLGVRWLASQIPKCKQEGAGGIYGDEFAWEDADWIGPLSVYAGGPKAIRKNGTCARYTKMRERVDAVRMFRTRIDHEMKKSGE